MRVATLADRPRIEQICNDPRIRAWTAPDGAGLCSALKYLTPPNFSVVFDLGCWLAQYVDQGRYIIHTNILPEARNRAPALCAQALQLTFTHTDAEDLLTMVPQTIPHAKLMARRMGFHKAFERKAVWPVAGVKYDMEFYRLGLFDWILSGACAEAGAAFHHRLHGELGIPAHPDDPAHGAFVGAAAEMIRAGLHLKAVRIYNRWAVWALYQPIRMLSEEPLRIDIRQCVLRVEDGEFYIEGDGHA
jgi:hypothetical protein